MSRSADKIDKINDTPEYAVTFWRRAAAFLTDLMIINIITVSQFSTILYKYADGITLSKGMTRQINLPSEVYIILFIISMMALLYFTFFEYYLGQTVGDMIFRMKVVSLKETDERISLWTAVVRNCFIMPFFPFYIFWVIEPLYLAFYRERFLEKITFTKTVVSSATGRSKNNYKEYKLEKV